MKLTLIVNLEGNVEMKIRKTRTAWCILVSTLICVGCQKELSKEDAFKNIKNVNDIYEIDMNFAYKDRRSEDGDHYQFGLRIDSYEGDTWLPMIEYSPEDGKLGIYIRSNGSDWEIGNLYSEVQEPLLYSDALWENVSKERAAQLKEQYQNPRWELVALQVDFEFWIEDFIISEDEENPVKRNDLELCYIVDMETKTRFKVSLEYIKVTTA